MTGAIIAAAFLVWLVAAYAFVNVARAQHGVWSLAPSGRRLHLVFALTSMNYPAVESALGAASTPHIARYRRAAGMFVACLAVFMVLVIVNIILGGAA